MRATILDIATCFTMCAVGARDDSPTAFTGRVEHDGNETVMTRTGLLGDATTAVALGDPFAKQVPGSALVDARDHRYIATYSPSG